MIKQAPRLWQLIVMAVFALSCFGVLLWLWLSFGGTVPLQPQGYRFHVHFPEATQLAQQADVRISGVPVGKVVAIERGPDNRTDATIEMRARYAPVPHDARAMLRTKTILGETYVDLTPGNRRSGMLPDEGTLPHSAVAPTVELDEIFRSFDQPTRQAFRTWMQSQAAASAGRGADINAAFAALPEFVAASEALMRELNAQDEAVSRMFASTGDFFDAISERDGQLRSLITESNRLFRVTAERNREFAAIWEELPRFERESRLTLPRLTRFSEVGKPVAEQLQPAADEMAATFAAMVHQGREFKGFFQRLGPVISASERGVPAFERTMAELPPLLEDFEPWLRNFNPMIAHLDRNRREVTSFMGNLTAVTNARDLTDVLPRAQQLGSTDPVHFLRVAAPLGPESLAFYPRPLGNSRANAYAVPDALDRLASGLPVYDDRGCSNGDVAPPASTDPPELQPLIELYVFRTTGRDVARPGCAAQGPHPDFGTAFPRLEPEP
jgi:phospholipid/cholesterol/gamma-HCH transport system substrate-binding protein